MNYSVITLTGGHTLLVDSADLPIAARYKWHAVKARSTYYAQGKVDGKPETLHRLLLSATVGELIDHRNLNGLDNRRGNLRRCNDSQNKANARPSRANSSGYKGVSWNVRGQKWEAYLHAEYRKISLGRFTDPWEAAQAYNRAALEQWGEFALLNERIQN